MTDGNASPASKTVSPRGAKWIFWLISILGFVLIAGFLLVRPIFESRRPLPQLKLADGRILQIEGVTYGTKHRIGTPAFLVERLGPWMPRKLRDRLRPKYPESTLEMERPGLVIWVNAIHPATGTNVNCQGIRTEFVDKHGDVFIGEESSWFGDQAFSRVGHVFYSYPRDEEQLTWRVTPGRKNMNTPVTAQFPNPNVTRPANWQGEALPQTKTVGPLNITLARLNTRTNEAKDWQSASVYLEPVWQLQQGGQVAQSWEDPEWTAEDPTGNRGQYLSRHWAALRFFATIYPTATNADATFVLATLPRVDLSALTNQLLWNSRIPAGTNEIVALGICPPGAYTFSGGNFDPTGPRMSAVSGGTPSGWTGQSKRVTPMKLQTWHGHYTPSPTIYIRAGKLGEENRLAIRLRDEAGQLWVAEPEWQGTPDGVHAFLIELPPEVTNVVAELVLLRPAQVEFLVETIAAQ